MVSAEEHFHCFYRHHAMVLTMHSAARRKTRLWRASKCKQRRALQKAEEQQQRDGYRSPHGKGCANNSTTALRRPVTKWTAAGFCGQIVRSASIGRPGGREIWSISYSVPYSC